MEASGIHFYGRRAHNRVEHGCSRHAHSRFGRACHHCLDEAGVALPVSLAVILVVGALATVAARASISASNQSFRDMNTKRATQAAYAGVQALRYQTNLLQPGVSECVAKSATDGALSVIAVQWDGWCGPQSEDLGSGASYVARISSSANITSNGQLLAQRKIVSTGIADGVKRRIALTVNAATGAPLFPPGYAAMSINSVDIGESVHIAGGLASNGNVTLSNTAQICGPVTPGPGKALTMLNSATVCGGFSTQPAVQDFQLQPVDIGDTATVNDNARLTSAVTGTGSPADACSSCDKIDWDPVTRVLRLNNDSTLTLSGGVYNFCQLELNNSAQLVVGARDPDAPLMIYVDSPEACGTGLGSARFRNNSGIVNLNSDPRTLQLRAVGSPTAATSVSFENSFDSTMIMAVFAPYSTIHIQNQIAIVGAVAGKHVRMENNSSLTYHERIDDIATGSSMRVYNSQDYIECTTAPTGTAPDAGC